MKFKRIYLLSALLIIFSCSSNNSYIPRIFFDLELKQHLRGEEAKTFVDKLHFKNVAGKSNEIGFYKGEKGSAVIYITYYATAESAKDEEVKMTEKISPENSVFIMGKYIDVNKEKIYRTFGMGQTHFVFTHDKALFWLSAETQWADDFLKLYLRQIGK